MNRRILDFIRQRQMLDPGDTVICGVSGGKDSMALLHILLELQDTLSITVAAAHFNHQLRGKEAQRDQDFVEKYCLSRSISLYVGSGDVAAFAADHGIGVEEAARQLRYAFLEGISPTAKIATAHHAQDNLETMLMHLIRGCGLHGLSGIPPVRGRIIRPLLTTPPEELETYLAARQIPHIEDSSNQSDDNLRNRLRHHVLPLLMQENPSLLSSASRLSLQLGETDQYLEDCAAKTRHTLTVSGGLSCSGLLSQPQPIAMRILQQFLTPVPELSGSHLAAAMSLASNRCPSAQYHLPGGYVLSRRYDTLSLESGVSRAAPAPVLLEPGQTVRFGPFLLSCQRGIAPAEPAEGVFPLDISGLSLPLTIRSRTPGDHIRLPAGHKKLSRLMVDLKIPAALRDQLPVAVQGQELLALLPYVVADRRRAHVGSPSLILTVKRTEEAL